MAARRRTTRSGARRRRSACGRGGSAAGARATARARRAARCTRPGPCPGPDAVVRRPAGRRGARAASGTSGTRRIPGGDPALDPDLVHDVVAPGREQADAVPRREHVVEPPAERRQRQVLVHALLHVVAGQDVEREPGDDAHRPERDGDPRERRRVGVAIEGHGLAVRPQELDRSHGTRQRAAADARPVGPGGAGARDRDVRQRREVVQREPGLVEERRQVAVPDAPVDGDGHGRAVDLDVPWQPGERDQVTVGVGDGVEGVPRPEDAEPVRGAHRRGARPWSAARAAAAPGTRRCRPSSSPPIVRAAPRRW